MLTMRRSMVRTSGLSVRRAASGLHATAFRATASASLNAAMWSSATASSTGERVVPYFSALGRLRWASTSTAAPSTDAPVKKPVLIKVGDGVYRLLPIAWDALVGMDSGALLTALADHKLFAEDLKGVPLGQCHVELLTRVAGSKPTAQEETGALELDGATTVAALLRETDATSTVYALRVRLPDDKARAAIATSVGQLPEANSNDAVLKAVAALRAGRVEVLDGSHLRLLDDAKWPCTSSLHNELFVRDCYALLYERVLRECKSQPNEDGRTQRYILTGQPGIGKSVYAWYIIYRLLRDQPRRTIVFVAANGACYIISPDGSVRKYSGRLCDLPDMRGLVDPVVICDSYVPPVLPYVTVLISSPGRLARGEHKDTFNSFSARLYMPVPSEEEVLRLRALAFPDQPEADVKKRMELWGPIPRLVLDMTSEDDQLQAWMDTADVAFDRLLVVAKAQHVGKTQGGEGDVPHRVVMERCKGQDEPTGSPFADMSSRKYYARGAVVFVSKTLARFMIDRMVKEQSFTAAFLVDTSARIGVLGSLRGFKFEEIALSALQQGGTFTLRNLSGGANNEWVVPASERVEFGNTDELAALRDNKSLLVPKQRNFASIDAFVFVDTLGHHVLINCTASPSHELLVSGVSSAVTALGWTAGGGWPRPSTNASARRDMQIPFYWVVPHDEFDGWTKPQTTHGATDDAMKAVQERIAQFVVKIPRDFSLKATAAFMASNGVKDPDTLLKEIAGQ